MATYVGLASTVIASSGTTSIAFNSISQSYTDLIARVYFVSASATQQLNMVTIGGASSYFQYDDLTAANNASPSVYTLCTSGNISTYADYPMVGEVVIFNYANTSVNKSLSSVFQYQASSGVPHLWQITGQTYNGTSAVTSLTFSLPSGSFGIGTRIDLYGVV